MAADDSLRPPSGGTPGYREWPSDVPDLVRTCWEAAIGADGAWTVGGAEYWGLAFTRGPDGRHTAQVVGPAVAPRRMTLRAGERSWGVDLQPHVFWRGLAKTDVLDELRDLATEEVGRCWWFELAGARLAVPSPGELDATVRHLRTLGLLVDEPVVAAALAGEDVAVPGRSLRRRVLAVTGLRRGQVEQVRRARRAYALLQQGATLADAAAEAGYADQSHMTRELRRLAGLTPRQVLNAENTSMS
ncbi:helix-turn-helix domain-containing protein [Kineococcus esterisolvens]|uniref:helix-turn-helix domain-containing protein n=1 Tax=unclassified Kineococcus TaxID=2621656 RepID=UPI003D7EC8BA